MGHLVQRFTENPLITPSEIQPSQHGLNVTCVMNPGVFSFCGKTWLILRVAERPLQSDDYVTVPVLNAKDELQILEFSTRDLKTDLSDPRYVVYDGVPYLSTISHLRIVASDNGVHFTEPGDFQTILQGKGALETYGIEDCRVTQMHGRYLLTFTEVSPNGVGVGLMETADWKSFTHHGMIFPPHNKDCAIFDRKMHDKYFAFNRPSGLRPGGHYMWISSSYDLKHWGGHQCILMTRPGKWDSARVGAGAAPIWTPEGWLAIYHGADASNRYCLGAILLDPDDPARVLARTDNPIMEPEEEYEREGFFGNVIFTNGHLVDGDTLVMYYGASDTVICGARLSINEIFNRF